MAGKYALIIGSSQYDDPNLGRLKAPDLDVRGLEEVLKSPTIGQFDEVVTLLNEGTTAVRKAIARFYDRRHRDDLLLLYFSGHGVKDEHGHLYLALRDTEIALLAGSAIEAAFISTRMDQSFSKRQLLLLDCCHSGAFSDGAKGAREASVGTAEAFEGTGANRVILTAADSTQYAWEGDRIIGDTQSSLFTHFLIEGLRTGAADRNRDGVVTVDELYDYVREQVVEATPRQTPRKWTYRRQGDFVLARNPFAGDPTLPLEIQEARNSKLSSGRLEAVHELEKLLRGHDNATRTAALAALKELALDDSRKVANAAIQALKACERDEQVESLARLPAEARHPPEGGIAPGAPAQRQPEDPRTPVPVGQGNPSDIFISYEHHDRKHARELASALAAEGWMVWWDRRIAPGEAFDVIIERELSTSRCVIVLWSTRSVRATWVKNEARRAARRAVLVPVLIEAVEPPLEFDNLQAADLTTWDETNTEHPEFAAVLDRIQALAPNAGRASRLAVERARREAAGGRVRHAIASLERFQHPDTIVVETLAMLRTEAARKNAAHAGAIRREREGERRAREFAAAQTEIEDRLRRGDLDGAEKALMSGDQEFGSLPAWTGLRHRLDDLREPRRSGRLDREHLEKARRESEARGRQPRPAAGATGREEARELVLRTHAEIGVAPGSPSGGRPLLGSRRVQAGLALLVLIAATWIVVSRRAPPVQVTQRDEPPPSAITSSEPAALPSAPREILVPPSPAVRNDKPRAGTANQPAPAPRAGVEEFRTRARGQIQSGDHVLALATVVEGLRLWPNDVGLNGLLTALLDDARSAAARSKQEAADLDARNTAADLYLRGLRSESEATRLERTGAVDRAVRAWRTATDQFDAAAARAGQLADQDLNQRERTGAKPDQRDDQPQRSQTAPPPPDQRPQPDSSIEQNLVNAALRRYEAAYASLNAQAVKDVYPAAQSEELAREFARYQSYVLRVSVADYRFLYTDALWLATVPATVAHAITPKSGKPTREERPQTFQLVKQGDVWVIRQIR